MSLQKVEKDEYLNASVLMAIILRLSEFISQSRSPIQYTSLSEYLSLDGEPELSDPSFFFKHVFFTVASYMTQYKYTKAHFIINCAG